LKGTHVSSKAGLQKVKEFGDRVVF